MISLLSFQLQIAATAAPVEVNGNRILPCWDRKNRRRGRKQLGILSENTHIQRSRHKNQPQGRQPRATLFCSGARATEEQGAREETDEYLPTAINIAKDDGATACGMRWSTSTLALRS